MPTSQAAPLAVHLLRAARVLGVSNRELGERFGGSRNTVGRWLSGKTKPANATVVLLARAVFPQDASLAAALAAHAGESLASLGLASEASAAGPSLSQLADSALCAGAEAGNQSPNALRPQLVAALARAEALGLSLADVLRGLREGGPNRTVEAAK